MIDPSVTIPATITGGAGGEYGDVISGGSGNDFLTGTRYLSGGAGNDTIIGSAGDDGLSGGAGNDCLVGGDGNDTFDGGAGGDTMLGGAGINSIDYSSEPAGIRFTPDNLPNDGRAGEGDNVGDGSFAFIRGSRF